MECPLSYQEILDAYTVNRWDTGQHFCIRVTVPDGSVLLKVNTVYTCCVIFFVGIENISSPVKSELINMIQAWYKEKSESLTGIEPMTS